MSPRTPGPPPGPRTPSNDDVRRGPRRPRGTGGADAGPRRGAAAPRAQSGPERPARTPYAAHAARTAGAPGSRPVRGRGRSRGGLPAAAAAFRRRTGVGADAALVALAGVITLVVAGGLALGGERDMTAPGEPTTPAALPEPEVERIVAEHTAGVRLPYPRNMALADVIDGGGFADEEQVRRAVDGQLAQWNLRADGTLVRNDCPPEARACVDLDNRLAWLQDAGGVFYGPVPTIGGPEAEPTPRGSFRVLWKNVDDISERYGQRLPFAVYFTDNGIAFHEGPLAENSHGCLHLAHQDAPTFFERLNEGDLVVIM